MLPFLPDTNVWKHIGKDDVLTPAFEKALPPVRRREIPLHQSMVVNTALDFISQGHAYVFNRPGDLWTLSEHFVTVELADVVQINVDG